MSAKERLRLESLSRVKRGEITVVESAGLMGLSLRQARRLWKRYRDEGDAGLVHRLRGRASGRRLPEELRERVVKRHQERYQDFGPTLACEKLAEEGLRVSPKTLTLLLRERGLWERHRRRGKHRSRRERRASFGLMLQMDGSHHDWFEGRAGKCVLMVIIDDATSQTYARLYPAETTDAAFDVFLRWAKAHGLPRELYVDRHGIYRDEEHPEKPTQFGRAMKELGVRLILAHSPQAKGRVERRNALFQDRLVKELRLRRISSMEQANAYLEQRFLKEINDRYAVSPRRETDLHRPVEAGTVLEEVLCVQEKRVVGEDWCVRWKNRWLQLDGCHAPLRLPRRSVLVKERGDRALVVLHGPERLTWQELSKKPEPKKVKKAVVNNRRWMPGKEHPWKRGLAERLASRGSPAPAAPARDFHAGRRKAG